jgi:vacuolar-type H+-ATPase subunit F/Vma7
MARIAVIGDEMTAQGMKLAGVRNSHIAAADNVQEIYDRVKADADIIVITHSLFESLKDIDNEKINARIPDKTGGAEDMLQSLVKQVVGFEVKA